MRSLHISVDIILLDFAIVMITVLHCAFLIRKGLIYI